MSPMPLHFGLCADEVFRDSTCSRLVLPERALHVQWTLLPHRRAERQAERAGPMNAPIETTSNGPASLRRLVRRVPCLPSVRGEIVGLSCRCGGRIVIKDWKGRASRAYRWEACCETCGSCDPNGYPNLKATCQGAALYFSPNDKLSHTAPTTT